MVKLLSRRTRKEKARAKAEKKASGDGSTTLSTKRDETDESIDTNCSIYSENNYHPRTSNSYMKKENCSTMIMYAQMSTTIAAALSKEEFGSQENSLYSPDAKYSSRVIYPVECKRDIFVESVTPVKFKNQKGKSQKRLSGKQSIYHANVGREHSPYHESSDVHAHEFRRTNPSLRRRSEIGPEATPSDRHLPLQRNHVFRTEAVLPESNNLNETPPYENQQFVNDTDAKGIKDDVDEMSLTLTYSSDEDKENEVKPTKAAKPTVVANNRLSINTFSTAALLEPCSSKTDAPRFQAINNRHTMSNTPFRSNNTNHLRVDTGRNGYEENAMIRPINHHISIDNGDVNGQSHSGSLFRGHHSVIRSVGETMDDSPSSTVSSLTLPAELEYHTPRDVVHSVSFPLPIISEDGGTFTEI